MSNKQTTACSRLNRGRRGRKTGYSGGRPVSVPDGDAQDAGVQVQLAPLLCRQQSRAAGTQATVSRCRGRLHSSYLPQTRRYTSMTPPSLDVSKDFRSGTHLISLSLLILLLGVNVFKKT